MSDTAPAPFRHDEWVRYNDRLVAAVTVASLGVFVFVVGIATAVGHLHVTVIGDWFTMDGDFGAFVFWNLVAAAGVIFGLQAQYSLRRARSIRRTAAARNRAAQTFAVAVAVAIEFIKVLLAVRGRDDDE